MRKDWLLVLFVAAVVVPAMDIAGGEGGALLKAADIHGGLVVHLGCGDGELTSSLRAGDAYLVHGLDTDSAKVEAARAKLLAAGLHGKVSIAKYDGARLPYLDNLVNLLVVSDPGQVQPAEMLRVVAPGGVVLSKADGLPSATNVAGGWKKAVKPRPKGMDEWPHYLRGADNNAVSQDELAGAPRGMHWMATPVWARHHDKQASISAVTATGGRIFYIVDRGPVHTPTFKAQWLVEARDAFSSVLLWSVPMKSWVSHTHGFRSGPVQLARLLVSTADKVYITMGIGEPVSILDAATGRVWKELQGTKNAEELILHDGVLLVVTGVGTVEHAYDKGNFRQKALLAVDPEGGKVLWRWPKDGAKDITPQTLAAAGAQAFLQDGGNTVCLNVKDGGELWTTNTFGSVAATPEKTEKGGKKGKKRGKKRGKSGGRRSAGWTFATLVVQKGVVLSCDGSKLCALGAADGKKLWEGKASTPFGKTPSTDILVFGDTVWTSPSLTEGRDIKTGKTVKQLDVRQTVTTAGHHHRCYRNKGIGEYVVYGHRGLDFYDTQGDDHSRNNWVRGVCQYGILAANGLVYLPPHNCGCYPEALIKGFFALRSTSAFPKTGANLDGRLEQGSGEGAPSQTQGANGDWPMYRRDLTRSGCSAAGLPTALKPAWTAELGGDLTPPVIADGVVVLSRKDTQAVMALDAATGKVRWTFAPGGVVDSAPTIHAGGVLFGARDGRVYCLNLVDGKLRWSFNAAPVDLNTVAMAQVESVWPVHGSILVKNGIAYFTAGRSTYLDGGIFLFGLDAVTGQLKHKGRVHIGPQGRMENTQNVKTQSWSQNKADYKTAEAGDHSDAFSMHGNLSDIMVADDDSVYLRHMRFNDALVPAKERKHHLLSTYKLIDDHEAHRSHWFYGNGDFSRLNVAYEWQTRGSYGGFSAPYGDLMVFDGKTAWCVLGKARKGGGLYACDIQGIDQRLKKDFPALKEGKGKPVKKWSQSLPLHARAMLKAGKALYIGGAAGTENLLSRQGGGKLHIASSADGSKIGETALSASPVFDGMAAADGKLFVSQVDGKLVCLGQ